VGRPAERAIPVIRRIDLSRGLLDFVAVGHVTIDRVSGRRRLGGAATFACLTAARLGLRSGLVTSAATSFPYWNLLEGVEIHCQEAARTTEFENVYEGSRRRQRVLAEADPLTQHSLASIRERLADDAAVLYCPVLHEVQLPLAPLGSSGLSGVAPQGFFRDWNPRGLVEARDWPEARTALEPADVVCMSEDDHPAPEELAEEFAGRAFAVTKGVKGARVYSEGDVYDLPAFTAVEVDPTGAGDVFAAAFLLALRERRPVVKAGLFAACVASFVVEAPGVEGIPDRKAVEARLETPP
jgi:sugar/nucleoside kinase (ribokinase family)